MANRSGDGSWTGIPVRVGVIVGGWHGRNTGRRNRKHS